MRMEPKPRKLQDADANRPYPFGLRTITELFDVGPVVGVAALALALTLIVAAVAYFFWSAPPSSLTITSGPEGSVFHKNALKYAKILERNNVKLNVLTSNGSLENIRRLTSRGSRIDIGLAQAGLPGVPTENLVSLGSVANQPLMLFYRGPELDLLSGSPGRKSRLAPMAAGRVPLLSPCSKRTASKKAGRRRSSTLKERRRIGPCWRERSTPRSS